MAYTFNFEKIKDWELVVKIPFPDSVTAADVEAREMAGLVWYEDDNYAKPTHYLNPITNGILWGMLWAGIPKITEDNWHEVWFRICMQGFVNDRLPVYDPAAPGGKRNYTREEVRKHVGLTTNANTLTGAAFYRQCINQLL